MTRVIHQAGPWMNRRQECAHCGALLADDDFGATASGRRVPYPTGTFVEITPHWKAALLTATEATCQKRD